jgi:hypothetical protein
LWAKQSKEGVTPKGKKRKEGSAVVGARIKSSSETTHVAMKEKFAENRSRARDEREERRKHKSSPN